MLSDERVSIAVARGQHPDRCDFCEGPRFEWVVDDATWALVAPLLNDQRACLECFAAAWVVLGVDMPDPLVVTITPGQAAA